MTEKQSSECKCCGRHYPSINLLFPAKSGRVRAAKLLALYQQASNEKQVAVIEVLKAK